VVRPSRLHAGPQARIGRPCESAAARPVQARRPHHKSHSFILILALSFLVGEWDLDYTYSLQPDGPEMTDLAGAGSIRTILDGTHLCVDYRVHRKDTDEPIGSAHGVFAWDSERGRYRYHWFESSGASLQATAHLSDADTLVLNWDNHCGQTFQRVHDDRVVLEMTCPEQGLTLRVDLSRKVDQLTR